METDKREDDTPSPAFSAKPLLQSNNHATSSSSSPTHRPLSLSQPPSLSPRQTSNQHQNDGSNQGAATDDDNEAPNLNDPEELKFYMNQIYLIVRPVIACIILTIIWVKISLMQNGLQIPEPGFSVYTDNPNDSSGTRLAGAVQNALIFIGTIVGATVVFVICFKFGYHKFLYAYLFFTVVMILGLIGYVILENILLVLNIPMDMITVFFSLWNFAVVGIIAVFWRAPLWLQQVYLVLMSSMTAFVLNGFSEWTTWIVLALLAIWDLIAVLCPFGPLKILIDSSREQNRDIPALLYSVTMIYYGIVGMADEPEKMSDIPLETNIHTKTKRGSGNMNPSSSQNPLVPESNSVEHVQSDNRHSQTRSPTGATQVDDYEENEDEEDDERTGLKLGLGDFIFYSVLIARTAMTDWVTTVSCFVAVMTGLNATIFLLATFRKALPALPISIAFGLLFFFASAYTLKPFATELSFNGVFI